MSGILNINGWERPHRAVNELADLCRDIGVSEDDLLSDNRRQDLVEARVYVARKMRESGYTYEHIGRLLKRHYSTIIHYLNYYKKS